MSRSDDFFPTLFKGAQQAVRDKKKMRFLRKAASSRAWREVEASGSDDRASPLQQHDVAPDAG
jgi:hypothetical protein